MNTILNNSQAMKVLKAPGVPVLRILPGYNYVEQNVDEYTKDNKVALSLFDLKI